MDSQHSSEPAATPSVVKDPQVEVSKIYGIESAEEQWPPGVDHPPFSQPVKKGDRSERSIRVLLATSRGYRPTNPKYSHEGTIRKRLWNPSYYFWTLHIYRQDYIVTVHDSPILGPHWKRWLGYKRGVEKKAIAFPIELDRQLRSDHEMTSDSDSDDRPLAADRKRRRAPAMSSAETRSSIGKRQRWNSPSPEPDQPPLDVDMKKRLEEQMNKTLPRRQAAETSEYRTHEQYRLTKKSDEAPPKPKRPLLSKKTVTAASLRFPSRHETPIHHPELPVSPPQSSRNTETPVATQRPAIKTKQPAVKTQKPTVKTQRPAVETQRPPVKRESPITVSSDSEDDAATRIQSELRRKEQDLKILQSQHKILEAEQARDDLLTQAAALEKVKIVSQQKTVPQHKRIKREGGD
ncbi:MAG: hypothetical protein Q9222_006191 [Ikaeria aurantiellina]